MFAPLAVTIAIALFVSLVLSLTLSPVLCSYFLQGGSGEDTKLIKRIKQPYLRLLDLALHNEKKTMLAAVGVFVLSLLTVPLLGTSFIPEMKEGSIVPNIIRVPNISLDESIKMDTEAAKIITQIPGVKSIVAIIGRGESPADPQSQNESQPIVSLLPRKQWPSGWSQEDIADAIQKSLKSLPGVQVVMAQPIAARVAELLSGVRSDVAVKLFGDDMAVLKSKADEIARIAGEIRGATDLRVEKVSGQQYLTVTIDRQAISRHGINAADVHEIIETAVGGKGATDIYEGQRRFRAAVRYPENFRNSAEAIGDILLTSPNGSRVALRDLAKIEVKDGPAQISREYAKRRIVVGVNVRERDLGGFVAELQSRLNDKLKLPEGYYLEFGGQFQNMQRALNHLALIVPITIGAIFFLLFLLFNSVRYATMIISVLPFASIGGIFALFITGEYLSVPASVGFIALWGIAVLNGVVLVSYIRHLRDEGKSQLEAIIQGCQQRFRPVMMTATVAMLGLVPFLFATGPGSEVQRPLAIVVIGGLITSTLLTLVVVPTLYRKFEEERVEASM